MRLSWTTQTFEVPVGTSRGCVQNVCISPLAAWRSVGPQLGAIWEWALWSRMILSVSVPDVYSLVSVHRLEIFHSSLWIYFVVTWYEISIYFWYCPNRFTTSQSIFKLCPSVVRTLRSRSQMHCLAYVPESLFTKYNTSLHHLHCYSRATKGFHLYTPLMFIFISYVISVFIVCE